MVDQPVPPPERDPLEDPVRTLHLGAGAARVELTAKTAYLTVVQGGDRDLGQYAVVKDEVVLGRSPEAHLPLHDAGISWRHARVSLRADGRCVVEDLGSTNGTRVGGARITGLHALANGDKVFLGKTALRFALADELDLDFQTEVAQIVGTDPLTGLMSKRRFDGALAFALTSARPAAGALAVLMLDMDGVKAINDRHGHFFGAHAIAETGRLIARVLEGAGHACRFGGDEFCVFLPDAGLEGALRLAEAIRAGVEGAGLEKDGVPLRPTISVGVALHGEDGAVADELVARADQALYRAKAAGRNCVRR